MVDEDKELVPYKITRTSNADAWVEIDGKSYSPSQISACILQKIKDCAGRPISARRSSKRSSPFPPISMTPSLRPRRMPARSRDSRSAVHHQQPEQRRLSPTGSTRTRLARSRSTTSGAAVSIFRYSKSATVYSKVKSTNGVTFLGGEDFDMRLVNYLADEFQKKQGIDLRRDKLALQQLNKSEEKAKIELSSTTQTEINLPVITADASGPNHFTMKLTHAKFEALVDDLREEDDRAVPSGPQGCQSQRSRDQRGRPGRWHDAHAEGPGGCETVLRQEAVQGRLSGRGPVRLRLALTTKLELIATPS